MQQYLNTLQTILERGDDRMTRNGMTRALFSIPLRFSFEDGFPAVTTKKLAFKSVTAELLWFLSGATTTQELKEIAGFDLKIWDGDAKQHQEKGKVKSEGELGPVYGKQWRRWQSPHKQEIDQLGEVVRLLKKEPFSRRLIVTAWNPGEIEDMALPPCHMIYQFFATNDKRLSLHMYQRSCDMFLGVPFNIASYALLLSMVAHVTGFRPGECILTLGDVHVYHAHFEQAREQLTRNPLTLPQVWLNPNVSDIDDFTMEDIKLENYVSHAPIKAPLLTKDILP